MKTSTMWAILAGIAFIILVSSMMDSKPEVYMPDNLDAFLMAKSFIKKGLKSPSTAEFANISESVVVTPSVDFWKVTSYVDSQNGFGAMIRTEFQITMSVDRDTKKWTVIEIETSP